jgi:hypothetical protein
MIILNMFIGELLAVIGFGFIAFIVVVIIEGVFISIRLSKKWLNKEIFSIVFISNLITTIIGVVFHFLRKGLNLSYVTYIIIALIISILIEGLINLAFLKRNYYRNIIIINTIYANIISYLFLVIYTSCLKLFFRVLYLMFS